MTLQRIVHELEGATPDELLDVLKNGSNMEQEVAIARLAKLAAPYMIPTLIELLPRAEFPGIAEAVARLLYRVGGEEVLAQLIAKVWDSDRQVLFRVQDCWHLEPNDPAFPEALRRKLEGVGISVPSDEPVERFRLGWKIRTGRATVLIEKADTHFEAQLIGLRSCYLEAAILLAPHELILPELLRALENDNLEVRMTALGAIGRAADRRAVARIRTLLGSKPEPGVLYAGLVALARIASSEALGIVLDNLWQIADLDEWKHVLSVVPESTDLDRLLRERAQQERDPARSALLQIIAYLRRDRARYGRAVEDDDASRDFLIEVALASTDDIGRRSAAEALRWARGDPGTEEFIAAMGSEDLSRRTAAAVALGVLQEDRAADVLKTALADPAVEVRVAAAASLCELRAYNHEAWDVLGDVAFGNEAESLQRCAVAALRMQPNPIIAICDRLDAAFAAGRFDAAEDMASRLLGAGWEDEAWLWVRGRAREAQGNLSGALEDYNHRSQFRVATDEADVARVLAALGRYDDAVAAQLRAARLGPDDAGLYVDLGWYAYLSGDYEESLDASRRALELDATKATAAFNIALVHLTRAEESEARRAYAAALAVAGSLERDLQRSVVKGARSDLEHLRSQHKELVSVIDQIDSTLTIGE